jgi:hypothetical protein
MTDSYGSSCSDPSTKVTYPGTCVQHPNGAWMCNQTSWQGTRTPGNAPRPCLTGHEPYCP